jgi:hypothetical protein
MASNLSDSEWSALSASSYLRQSALIGVAAVTPEQAEANKRTGKSPTRPRAGRQGLVPFSSATLWRKVKSGEFPAPVKLSERITAWKTSAVLAYLRSHGE